jgi:hypothetical protein
MKSLGANVVYPAQVPDLKELDVLGQGVTTKIACKCPETNQLMYAARL